MIRQQRLLVRMAIAIHERLGSRTTNDSCVTLPAVAWQQCETLNRKIRTAVDRGWTLAADRLNHDLRVAVERLRNETATLHCKLQRTSTEHRKATVNDIYADLVALHDEFAQVTFNQRKRVLSVTTEAIELDGIHLGPFEIRLDWTDIAEGHPHNYRVIAVDPHPAASNDRVTHPHVQDEVVCEGDAREPVCQALEQGRLLDFFMIIASLLRTYNSGSPFVSLSEWHSIECAECGNMVCGDERRTCEICETTVCGDCCCNCTDCDGNFCNECMTRCGKCDCRHCTRCMRQCSRCDCERCRGCLDDNERCSDCHDHDFEEEAEPLDRNTSGHRSDDAIAPLQPNRVGQVAVPS